MKPHPSWRGGWHLVIAREGRVIYFQWYRHWEVVYALVNKITPTYSQANPIKLSSCPPPKQNKRYSNTMMLWDSNLVPCKYLSLV